MHRSFVRPLCALFVLASAAGFAGSGQSMPGATSAPASPVGVSGTLDLERLHHDLLASVPAASDRADRGSPPGAHDTPSMRVAQRDAVFWAFDFHLREYYRVRATLATQSRAAWIYVEDGLELNDNVAIDIAHTFDETVDPAVRDAYGWNFDADIDGEAAVTLLLLDIRDPLHHQEAEYTYFTGYFDPVNERRQAALDIDNPRARSNEREMIYIDAAAPTDLMGTAIRQTVAHEFAHLVQWTFDEHESDWLVEGLSELAVYLSGLGHPREHVLEFLSAPGGSLVTWDGQPRDYGKVYLFMLYLHEQAGEGDRYWLRRLVANPADGMGALSVSLALDRAIPEMLRDFALAIHVDVDEGDGGSRFGFRSLDLFTGPTLPDTYPAAEAPSRAVRDADRILFEPEPWSLRVEALDAGARPFEIEVDAPTKVCLAAGRVPVRAVADVRADCARPGVPVIWAFDRQDDGALPAPVLLAMANGSDLPTEVTISIAPELGIYTEHTTVFLPTALAAR